MKYLPSVCLALGCALLAGSANAAVTVSFSHPENYTGNFAYYGSYGRHDFGNYGEILCAEKQMLDRWFKKTLMPAKGGV